MEIISRKEAIERGIKTYFTGSYCKYGHLAPRHTKNSTCVECQKIRIKNWSIKNKERVYQYNKELYLSQKNTIGNWYHRNKQKALEYNKKYRQMNRDKVNQIAKNYTIRHPERRLETCRLSSRNRRSKVSGAGGFHTKQDIIEIYLAQNGRCSYCKVKVGRKYHVDHIIPISKGGTGSKDNLQICCPSCNLRKNAKDPIDFAQEIGLLI